MSETRTHEPTRKRLARAREQGDVAISPDLASAAVLACVCAWGAVHGAMIWTTFERLARAALSGRIPAEADAWQLASALGWLMIAVPAAVLLITFAQRGFGLRLSRAEAGDFGQRVGRGWSADTVLDAISSAIKVALLAGVLLYTLRDSLPGVIAAFRRAPDELAGLFATLALSLALRAAVALAVIGVGDWLYRRYRRAQRLRMTRSELMRERRQDEGDPQLLHERRARGRALLFQANLAELDAAHLVLVAGERALALRYDPERDNAPRLWLKAQAAEAERLIARAHALALPVHDDETLVAELYRLELSQYIPEAAHARVAAMLVAGNVPGRRAELTAGA